MVVRGPSGGGVHGGPFHSANPEMYFVHTPGLKVVYPSTAYDAKGLLKSAIRDNNPVLFFEHKFLYRGSRKNSVRGIHRSDRQSSGPPRRQGSHHPQLRGNGACHAGSRQAASERGNRSRSDRSAHASACSIATRFSTSVKKTNKLLIVHEDTRTGGIAGEIAAIVCESAFEDLDGPITRVTALDTPVPYSPPLEERFLPNAEKVAVAARELAKY